MTLVLLTCHLHLTRPLLGTMAPASYAFNKSICLTSTLPYFLSEITFFVCKNPVSALGRVILEFTRGKQQREKFWSVTLDHNYKGKLIDTIVRSGFRGQGVPGSRPSFFGHGDLFII